MSEDSYAEGFTCAFCAGDIPTSSPELRRVTVAAMEGFPSQEFFAHRACVVKAISPKIPLGEVLDGET